MRGYHARQTLRRAGTLLMGPTPVKGKFRFGAAVLSHVETRSVPTGTVIEAEEAGPGGFPDLGPHCMTRRAAIA